MSALGLMRSAGPKPGAIYCAEVRSMSKYVKYDLSTLRDQEVLIAALNALGYDSKRLEVNATPQQLIGYQGDRRMETAEIIIRRQNTGIGASNDIGFKLQPDGTWLPIVSEYDSGALRFDENGKRVGHGGPRTLVQAVERAYGHIMSDKAIHQILTKTLPSLKARGLIPRSATAARVQSGQTTKIVCTYEN